MTDRPDNPPMSELTARDFLAAAALEGCVEKQFSDALLAKLGSTEAVSAAVAGAAYQIADACLLARTKGVDPLFAVIEERDALLAACEAMEAALSRFGPQADELFGHSEAFGAARQAVRDALARAKEPS